MAIQRHFPGFKEEAKGMEMTDAIDLLAHYTKTEMVVEQERVDKKFKELSRSITVISILSGLGTGVAIGALIAPFIR